MQVYVNKFGSNIGRFDRVEVAKDGSVRLIKYEPIVNDKQLVDFKKDWRDNLYNLTVNLPPPRELDTIVIVSKTSANCYKVIVSTQTHTEITTCKTYDEVNAIIKHSTSEKSASPGSNVGHKKH